MALALLAATLSPLLDEYRRCNRWVVSILLALSGGAAIGCGLIELSSPAYGAIELPIGLPWLPMSLKLDPLAGFFMLTIGGLLFPVGIYSTGYLKGFDDKSGLQQLGVCLPLFAFGMQGVVLADNAYTFMVFWELMSLSSYFLVTFEHEKVANRKAGFLYLLMAHLAGLLILGSFAILYSAGGSFRFDAMRIAEIDPGWASVAFLLAGLGFGMKAGIVPMHVWLPEAHPAAPSNVSALMSGLMLKVAIFGFLRVVWDLIGVDFFHWWWGAIVLAAGSGSAVSGVLMALQQHDLKRLLAYHSVENIGIIVIGIGLGMIFSTYGQQQMAALGLIAGLYHTINHALFKGLLFMGAGAVVHATGSGNMEEMGGLIHRIPITAVVFLVGCISISALPPFNGFVSEWLTFQAALMAPHLEGTLLAAMIPFSASMLALSGALAATCFVKVYGIVFLGHARSTAAANSHEVDQWMLAGMIIPAACCLLLGLLPTFFLPLLDRVPQLLIQTSLGASTSIEGWSWLTPVSPERASYSAPIVLLGLVIIGGLIFWWFNPKNVRIRRGSIWSCGHPSLNPRMQYTATSFSHPLRYIFSGFYRREKHVEVEQGSHPLMVNSVSYKMHVHDPAHQKIILPIGKITLNIAEWVAYQHQRGIHAYLAYIFIMVLFLLGWLSL